MKSLFLFLALTSTTFAQDVLMGKGELSPLVRGVKVQGEVSIFRTSSGQDYVQLEGFKLSGGVVLDLKVCGSFSDSGPFCVSVAEPRPGLRRWPLMRSLDHYSKVVIFDLDLIQDLAEAQF